MTLRATSHETESPWPFTLSALIGGKGGAGPSSLHTTLEGPTDQVSARWMKTLHSFLRGIQWIMFHGHLDYFQNPSLGVRPNTKPGDRGTPNAHNRWFILSYHVWGPRWIEIHYNSIWLGTRSRMTSHYTWGSVTTLLHGFGGVLGRPLNTFLLGSHNFMVTALGSCVKVALNIIFSAVAEFAPCILCRLAGP